MRGRRPPHGPERRRFRRAAAVRAGAVALVAAAAAACDRPGLGSVASTSEPTRARGPSAAGAWISFTDVTAESGLASFVTHAGVPPPKNWLVETTGGGLCAADFDGDGDADLFLTDGAELTLDGEVVLPPGSRCRLYRNDGGFRFADVTDASGAGVRGYFLAAAAADADGDGDVDLCTVGYDARRFLRNRGDGTFDDATEEAGLVPAPWETAGGCAWGDVDGDGRLDLFVGNYTDQRRIVEFTREHQPGRPRACEIRGVPVFCGPVGLHALANRLYLQQADGRFRDASDRLREPVGATFQPALADLDGDGDLDVYVPNDGWPNALLVNDGSGTLTDRAVEAGAATDRRCVAQGSMGVAIADFDLDLRPDVAVTNFSLESNSLLRNRTLPGGVPAFSDDALTLGFTEAVQRRVFWGVGLVDFDQDSLLDAYLAAGDVYGDDVPAADGRPHCLQTNQALRNLGAPDFRFEDVSADSGAHFSDARLWRGAVFPDLDGDGDPDVVVTALHAAPAVLRNDGGERNAWLRLDLRPRPGLPTPAGARVTITLPDGSRRRSDLLCGSSYASSDDPRIHFGLGTATTVPAVEVRWPDGTSTALRNVPARQVVVVRQ